MTDRCGPGLTVASRAEAATIALMIRAYICLMLLPILPAVDLVDDERYRFLVERYEASLANWDGTPFALPLQMELAGACFDARMYWRGAEVLEQVVERYPDYAGAWSNLSVNYGKMGMYDKAITAADRSMALEPDQAMHAKLVKASWLLRSGEVEAAQALVDATPNPGGELAPFFHTCLACFHADAGNVEALKEHIDRARVLDPDGDETFYRRDVVFDPYRDQPWFIERFGTTLAGGSSADVP